MTLSRSRVGPGHAHYTTGHSSPDQTWLRARALDGAIILRPDEDINAANTERTTALAQFISLRAPLVIDLRGLRFLSRSGWQTLLAVGYWYREAGVPCIVVTGAASPPHLNVSGDAAVLPVTNSLPEALRRVHRSRGACCPRPPIVARQHTRC